jgi:AAA+ superfamily predicted ATPase
MTTDWQTGNLAYLSKHIVRLRFLIRRRVLWLREGWRQDAFHEYPGLVIADAEVDRLLETDALALEGRFYVTDPSASALSGAAVDLDKQLKAEAESMRRGGPQPALLELAERFQLTAFERQALLLCLAPEMDPAFERLYAYLHDDVSRKQMTPHLAVALLADPGMREGLLASFLPHSRLISSHIIELEHPESAGTPLGHASLRVPRGVVGYLVGGPQHLDRAVPLRPMTPVHVTRAQQEGANRIAAGLRKHVSGAIPAVNLFGRPEAATGIALSIGDHLGLEICRLDAEGGGLPDRGVMELVERDCRLLGLGLFVETSGLDRAERTSVLRMLEHVDALLIVSSREPLAWSRAVLTMETPTFGPALQIEVWRKELGKEWPEQAAAVDSITEQYNFGPEAIARTVARARASIDVAADDGNGPQIDLWQACRSQVGTDMEEVAQRIKSVHVLDDIVLPPDVMEEIQDIAAQVENRARVYGGWGFGGRLSRGAGVSALFSGVSGTGKTMAAEILAGRLGLDLYRIDLAGVVSKYIGETEKNLRRVFDAAEKSGVVLFFDEADALFGRRSEVRDSHDRYANIEIDYLLQRMEDYRGLAILATNRKTALDRAFMRRLRFLIEFPFPDAASRLQIWRKAFPPQAPIGDIDLESIARMELSGGSIRNVSLNAAFLAAAEGAAIGMAHVRRAALREYAKLDKLVTAAELGAMKTRLAG